MQTLSADTHPVVRAAVAALDAFGATDRPTATYLLGCWVRRFQLTAPDVAAILNHYPLTDPCGFDYSREPDNGAPDPLPPGVVGGPLGKRADR